jgi:Cu-Zn family superoxide dismutase
MTFRAVAVLGFELLVVAVAAAQVPAGTAGASINTASASLTDTEGRTVGEARLQQTPRGVLVQLDLRNATPGIHALHVHEVGRCDAPAFESAGAHFDHSARQHGFLNPRGQHAGDLPNVDVPTSRQVSVEFVVMDVTLDSGPHSLLDANGSSIVMHSGKDDHLTDPSGASGDRIVCGRIARSDTR